MSEEDIDCVSDILNLVGFYAEGLLQVATVDLNGQSERVFYEFFCFCFNGVFMGLQSASVRVPALGSTSASLSTFTWETDPLFLT